MKSSMSNIELKAKYNTKLQQLKNRMKQAHTNMMNAAPRPRSADTDKLFMKSQAYKEFKRKLDADFLSNQQTLEKMWRAKRTSASVATALSALQDDNDDDDDKDDEDFVPRSVSRLK